jgi:hypothetical protein
MMVNMDSDGSKGKHSPVFRISMLSGEIEWSVAAQWIIGASSIYDILPKRPSGLVLPFAWHDLHMMAHVLCMGRSCWSEIIVRLLVSRRVLLVVRSVLIGLAGYILS